jgi:hypothetical protein
MNPSHWVKQGELADARDKFAINHIAILENYKARLQNHVFYYATDFTGLRDWRNWFCHSHNVAFRALHEFQCTTQIVSLYEKAMENMKQQAQEYYAILSDPTAWTDKDYTLPTQVEQIPEDEKQAREWLSAWTTPDTNVIEDLTEATDSDSSDDELQYTDLDDEDTGMMDSFKLPWSEQTFWYR